MPLLNSRLILLLLFGLLGSWPALLQGVDALGLFASACARAWDGRVLHVSSYVAMINSIHKGCVRACVHMNLLTYALPFLQDVSDQE